MTAENSKNMKIFGPNFGSRIALGSARQQHKAIPSDANRVVSETLDSQDR